MNVVTPDPAGNEMIASVVTRGKHIIRQETNPANLELKIVNLPLGSRDEIATLLGPEVQSLDFKHHPLGGIRVHAKFANIDDRNAVEARINQSDSPYILVENVEPNCTADQLKLFCRRYGDVEKVMLRVHDDWGKKTGLIIFRSEQAAKNAYDHVRTLPKRKKPFFVLAVVTNNRVPGYQQPPQQPQVPQAPQGHQRPPRPQQRPQAPQRYQQPLQQPPRPHAPQRHQQAQRQPQRLQGYPVVLQRVLVPPAPVPLPVVPGQQPQLIYPGQYQQYPGMGPAVQVPPGGNQQVQLPQRASPQRQVQPSSAEEATEAIRNLLGLQLGAARGSPQRQIIPPSNEEATEEIPKMLGESSGAALQQQQQQMLQPVTHQLAPSQQVIYQPPPQAHAGPNLQRQQQLIGVVRFLPPPANIGQYPLAIPKYSMTQFYTAPVAQQQLAPPARFTLLVRGLPHYLKDRDVWTIFQDNSYSGSLIEAKVQPSTPALTTSHATVTYGLRNDADQAIQNLHMKHVQISPRDSRQIIFTVEPYDY